MNFVLKPELWRSALLLMLLALALVAFWPSPVDAPVQGQLAAILEFLHAHGMPALFNYRLVEASSNVALFIPFGFVATLAFAEKPWWQIGAFGLTVSGCMELGQLLFLHNRFASILDLVTNTSGAVIGACLAQAVLKRLRARRLPAKGPKGVETAS